MDRLRQWHKRNRAWVQQHPWTYSILAGIWMAIVMEITGYVIDNPSIGVSVVVWLIIGTLFTLVVRIALWMEQRRLRNPPSSRRRAWETASLVGVLGWLVAWNILVFGFDTNFAVTIVSSIAAGIIVALLAHQVIVTRKPPRENVRE